MKHLFRVLSHSVYYKLNIGLNLLFNILAIIFSALSLAMVAPFLQLLFKKDIKPILGTVPELQFSVESFLSYFEFIFTGIILNEGRSSALVFICISVIIVFFFKNLFRYLAVYFLAPWRNGILKDIRNELFNKILDLPLGYYTEKKKGDIITRVTSDIQEIEVSIVHFLEIIFKAPLTVITYLGVMLYMSPELTGFIIVTLVASGYIIGRIGKSLKNESRIGQERIGDLVTIMEETISGLRIIKSFNIENYRKAQFGNINQKLFSIQNAIKRRQQLSSPLSEFLGISVVAFVLWYGGNLVLIEGIEMTPEVFITFIVIFSQVITPAKSFSTAYYNIRKGMASSERIVNVLEQDILIKEVSSPQEILKFNDSISIEGLRFSYQEKEVLKGIDLKVEKGKCVALVGPSGAGKTTLVDLIPRFYDINSGKIEIDGFNIKELKLKSLRNLIGVVSQHPVLFNDTVFNNIAIGFDHVKEEDVYNAAKIANAHTFIEELDNGYQTNIGDQGNKLSGGQKQRITIARAILRNPPILILDEATSALDTESEKLVQEALIKLMKDRTSIVIAHRLSTIKHADEIIVLKEGQIKERGSHKELLSLGGIYDNLVSLQNIN